MKRESRVLVVLGRASLFCALVLRGCSRIEKVFLGLTLEELKNSILASNVLGEVKTCIVGSSLPQTFRVENIVCKALRLEEVLSCSPSEVELLNTAFETLCENVGRVLAGLPP